MLVVGLEDTKGVDPTERDEESPPAPKGNYPSLSPAINGVIWCFLHFEMLIGGFCSYVSCGSKMEWRRRLSQKRHSDGLIRH